MADEDTVTMRPARTGKPLVQFCTYEERQDALRHTAFMEDDVSHRASRIITADNHKAVNEPKVNGRQTEVQNGHDVHIPPPPPQFANMASSTKTSQTTKTTATASNALQNQTTEAPVRQIRQQAQTATTTATTAAKHKPPTSPVPDYEPAQMRTTQTHAHSHRESTHDANVGNHSNSKHNANSTNNNSSSSSNNNQDNGAQRRTLRLGVLTIGEYDQLARKEPSKFEFLQTQKRHNTNGSNNNNNMPHNGTSSLQAELQHTLQRSNLKKANGIAQMQQQQNQQQQHYQQQQQLYQQHQQQQQQQQHQHHCPLQNNYENFDYRGAVNVGNMTRKMQATTISGKAAHNGTTAATTIPTTSNGSTSTGILKNTSNRHSNGYTKNHEKSISFGN